MLNLSNQGQNNTPTTILVPSNKAFDNYRQDTGQSVESLQSSDLTSIVNYHTLNGALSSSDLQQPSGLVSETALRDPKYDNRGLDSNGAKQPQVVFIGSKPSSSISARQAAQSSNIFIQSGLTSDVSVDSGNGTWDGGFFYIINRQDRPFSYALTRSCCALYRD